MNHLDYLYETKPAPNYGVDGVVMSVNKVSLQEQELYVKQIAVVTGFINAVNLLTADKIGVAYCSFIQLEILQGGKLDGEGLPEGRHAVLESVRLCRKKLLQLNDYDLSQVLYSLYQTKDSWTMHEYDRCHLFAKSTNQNLN